MIDYAAIGRTSKNTPWLCDEAKPGQILIRSGVLTKVENAVKVEPVGEFELKGIRRPLALASLEPVSDDLLTGIVEPLHHRRSDHR